MPLTTAGTLGSCRANSFTGRTLVLMADGTQKPISQVRVGDWVLATDPATGVTLPKQVTDLIVGTGAKQLKRIVTAGRQIVATDGHPFYTANTGSWTNAADLRQGDQLVGADGSLTKVSALIDADQATTVYNLSVNDIHTYYAGEHSVLVHNCDPSLGSGNAYSVAYETHLPKTSYPGRSRPHHFQEANRNLLRELDTDADVARGMEEMIPGIRGMLINSRGTIARRPPSKWTWHHAANEEGLMQLVPKIQHTAAGKLQSLFHPGGRGGFGIWG